MDWKCNDKKVLDPSAAIIKEQVSPDGGWWRVTTFIIVMRDISHSLRASTVLKILHLTLIAFLK